jgi:hypothetical protein
MPICAFCFHCELRQPHSGTDGLYEKTQHFGIDTRSDAEGKAAWTSKLVLCLIAGEWAMRYRHFCLPQTEVLRPRSNRDLSPPTNVYTRMP